MSLIALCSRRSVALLIAAAADEAAVKCHPFQADGQRFCNWITANQPRFALLTQDYLNEPSLVAHVRAESPHTQLIICLTDSALMPQKFWASIDDLDFDVVCTLSELPSCLQTLNRDQFFKSSLL